MESQQQQQDEEQDEEVALRYFIYGYLAICFVVIVLSLVLLLGLLIPLLIQLKNGNFYQNARIGRSRRQREPPYSTYNLYLVYLALVDLIFFGLSIAADTMAMNQKFNPRFYSGPSVDVFMNDPPQAFEYPAMAAYLNLAYAMANMWINAIIAYEVLILLKATHRAQRINQPSLRRVNLQAGGVILGSMICGALVYYSYTYGWFVLTILVGSVIMVVPFVYVIGVSILVKWRGYMPAVNGSTPRDRAVRGLVFYFLRITLVFIVVWLPSMLLGPVWINGAAETEEDDNDIAAKAEEGGVFSTFIALAVAVIFLLVLIQPIITFCMALTKDDVKEYIKDLVTLKYIFGDCSCCNCSCGHNKASLEGANENTNERAPTTTILGYKILDEDADEDVNADTKDNANVEAGDHTDDDSHADPCGDHTGAASMVVVDDDDDDMHDGTGNRSDSQSSDVENGIRRYKSRVLRGGAVAVLATGETVSMETQSATAIATTTAPAAANRE